PIEVTIPMALPALADGVEVEFLTLVSFFVSFFVEDFDGVELIDCDCAVCDCACVSCVSSCLICDSTCLVWVCVCVSACLACNSACLLARSSSILLLSASSASFFCWIKSSSVFSSCFLSASACAFCSEIVAWIPSSSNFL